MCKHTTIFAIVDDFCKVYKEWISHKLIKTEKQRDRSGKLELSESLSIMIFYHFSCYRNFKRYYQQCIIGSNMFKDVPCYERFIQIIPSLFLPLAFMMHYISGRKSGIYFADSTYFAVCKNTRISSHKTFDGYARLGRSSVGWFYGFKLHLIINDKAEIVALKITKGNKDDRAAFEQMAIKCDLKGKCFADKGYISKSLFTKLYTRGLQLITGVRKDMKNHLMPILDKLFLRKRSIIETVFGYIKEQFNIRPSMHRSPVNFFVSLLAAFIAYQIKPSKPRISYP